MGPYDNEAQDGQGSYVESSEWKNGQWLVDEGGNLFIVPIDADQVEGPEGATADDILKILINGKQDALTPDQMRVLGLCEVQHSLRRFSSEVGYFHA